MPTRNDQSNRARAVWLSCLASGYRAALACTIVGLVTLYGPKSLGRQVAFPAFSYVTVILVVTDATLGDTLRGCWLALYATVQSIGPAILCLWLIGPTRFTSGTTALAVALAAYVVVLPEKTHLVAKRIALGQIVITYVLGFIYGEKTEAIWHPVHVAASTAVGVLACVLALLLPYPRLACRELKQNCKQLAENASERLKLYVGALHAEDNTSALASISKAKSLAVSGSKILQSIKRYQESMKWERPPFKFLRPYCTNPGEKLGQLEILLKRDGNGCNQYYFVSSSNESNGEDVTESLQTLQAVPTAKQDLPPLFFLFCVKLLHSKSMPKPTISAQENSVKKNIEGLPSKPNGFWSGLPVAIGIASAREATFKVANVKAQGTVIGTVYGAGGISAVIGAVLILGRKNFGPPSEFAIARIVETFIGLSCSIMVDLLFQPTRASTLAKVQLSKSLGMLHDCVGSMSLQESQGNLLGNQKKLKLNVNALEKCIGEADVEPNFWFLPFHGACYSKLLGSLSKMADLLHFAAHSMNFLEQESQETEASWKESVNKLDGDLKLLKEVVGSSIKCFQDITMIKSLRELEKKLEKRTISYDLELGKSANVNRVSNLEENGMEKFITSYLQHSNEVVDKIHVGKGDQKALRSQAVLSLSALGYCMQSLITETRKMEEGIKELVQWENPSSNVNLLEISCKIHALSN
ncbi:hypothetical protein Patl1_30882 [Pistacia atlantica]|uniref:Uncharacterized protein n=1 Tax=Pistacia atlantica TaxID=434234 RepID=A0ACC1AB04_9ROSI|nr:hypothetical protein Patl1_30882 [Pistacia atlantica]